MQQEARDSAPDRLYQREILTTDTLQLLFIMDWFKNIKIEQIPSVKIQEIARYCGIADAIALMCNVPGVRLYIPEYGKQKQVRDDVIQNYNGKNLLSLSVRLGIDTKRVKYLVSNRPRGYKKPYLSNYYIRLVADKCGEQVAKNLIEYFHGQHIYIPLNGFSLVRRSMIESEFNGCNTTTLALKYHVSESYVREIIAEYHASKKTAIQLDLFENAG